MSSYRCCDCGEIKATKCELEAHLNSDHIGWSPYQCFYCCQQGVSTRKPNKEMIREHVTERHPNQSFTFLCTDDQTKQELLNNMLHRSLSNNHYQSLDETSRIPVAITAQSADENVSQFVLSTASHPQSKEGVPILEELEGHPPTVGMKTLTQAAEKVDVDVKQNFSDVGDCRCATCHESVPRNLVLIRDHVKQHFKQKTGCLPVDLTNLLPNLQQIYCQLLIKSFPSVSASILDDDIQSCNKVSKGKEVDDNDTTQVQMVCELNSVEQDPKSATFNFAQRTNNLTCDVCERKFGSMHIMHCHRKKKHSVAVKWHCKPCNLNLSGSGGYVRKHLLHVHLHKYIYECSLCGKSITPGNINRHDTNLHGGVGKALVISNMNCYKTQLEVLCKRLIVDLNSSLNSENKMSTSLKLKPLKIGLPYVSCRKLDWQQVSEKSAKFAPIKGNTTKTGLSCQICRKSFQSASQITSHRSRKHGIPVNWYCKQCKINLESCVVSRHLLIVHMGNNGFYACSLCKRSVEPAKINRHDQVFHGGLGNAQSVNNLNRYKVQVDELRRKLIVDQNSSLSSAKLAFNFKMSSQKNPKSIALNGSQNRDQLSLESYITAPKIVDAMTKKKNNILTCQICHLTFSSLRLISIHRTRKHGIFVQWYCTQCKINLKGKCLDHFLKVHLEKSKYVCSICGSSVNNKSSMAVHDQNCHNGLVRARAIYNPHRYQKEIQELRDALLIDMNAMVNVGNTVTLPHKPSFHRSTTGFQSESRNSYGIQLVSPSTSGEPIVKIQSKSECHITTDNLNWLKRFKQSQKRKQKQSEILTIKRSAVTQQWSCKIKQK